MSLRHRLPAGYATSRARRAIRARDSRQAERQTASAVAKWTGIGELHTTPGGLTAVALRSAVLLAAGRHEERSALLTPAIEHVCTSASTKKELLSCIAFRNELAETEQVSEALTIARRVEELQASLKGRESSDFAGALGWSASLMMQERRFNEARELASESI